VAGRLVLNYGSGGTYGRFDRFGRITSQKRDDGHPYLSEYLRGAEGLCEMRKVT